MQKNDIEYNPTATYRQARIVLKQLHLKARLKLEMNILMYQLELLFSSLCCAP